MRREARFFWDYDYTARGRWASDWVALGPPKIMRTAPYISPNLDFSREWGLLSPARATVTPQGLSRGPKWYPELRHERGQSGDTHSHGGRGVG